MSVQPGSENTAKAHGDSPGTWEILSFPFLQKLALELSGGSHYTVYDADVEFIVAGSGVQVVGSEPKDALPGSYEMAVESIRKGAEQVLNPLKMGAIMSPIDPVWRPIPQFSGNTA